MRRILVIEDYGNLRRLYREELELEGYKVTAVENGAQALAAITQNVFDAVILDIRLPDVCGVQLLNEISARQRRLPIIINTGYPEFRNDFRCWGAEAFLLKTSDFDELKKTLVKIFSQHSPIPHQYFSGEKHARERCQQESVPLGS